VRDILSTRGHTCRSVKIALSPARSDIDDDMTWMRVTASKVHLLVVLCSEQLHAPEQLD
jgi:hypothetical protein